MFFQLEKNSCRDLTMKKTKVFQLHLDDLFSMARRRNWGETRLHSDAIAAPPSLYKPGNRALSPFAKKGFHWLTLQHAQPNFIKFPPFLASNGCPTLVKSNIFGRLLTLRHLGFFGSRIRVLRNDHVPLWRAGKSAVLCQIWAGQQQRYHNFEY